MPDPLRTDTAMPAASHQLNALARLACLIALSIGLSAISVLRRAFFPQAQRLPASVVVTACPTKDHEALRWRGPWWAWQLLSWTIATSSAPTFLLTGGLLLLSSHSDHPLFWWSLPGIVGIGNGIGLLLVNQRHHRRRFTSRASLAWHYAGISMTTGALLFLVAGCLSGFLSEISASTTATAQMLPTITLSLWSSVAAVVYAVLSFGHAGAVHAWLAFRPSPAATTSEQIPLTAKDRKP